MRIGNLLGILAAACAGSFLSLEFTGLRRPSLIILGVAVLLTALGVSVTGLKRD
jgi:ABC-type uncharacterized transport system permease subunit